MYFYTLIRFHFGLIVDLGLNDMDFDLYLTVVKK